MFIDFDLGNQFGLIWENIKNMFSKTKSGEISTPTKKFGWNKLE